MFQLSTTYLVTITVAFCSIVYELLLAQTLSTIMGNTVLRYSITIGIYLASLGIGAMLCEEKSKRSTVNRLVRIEVLLTIVGGLVVLLMNFFDVIQKLLYKNDFCSTPIIGDYSLALIVFYILSHGIIVLIGILSGYEIPLLIAIGEKEKPQTTNVVLGMDYFGSLLGSIFFPLILLPGLGIFGIAFLTGLFNCIATITLLFTKKSEEKYKYLIIASVLGIMLLIGLLSADTIKNFYTENFYYL
jgi:spermidine synthase